MKSVSVVPWLASALIGATNVGAVEEWPVKLSETSSRELAALHETLLSPRLDGVKGVPVANVVWKVDALEIRIKSGAVFLEPPLEGAPVGAFFVGSATAHFIPVADEQRRRIGFWFGKQPLDGEPITSAYFFTLHRFDLLAQLGVAASPTVAFEAQDAYAEAKQALRRKSFDALEAFLNRKGRSHGTAMAVMVAPGVRTKESKSSLLMLRLDPTRREESGIEAYGHDAVASRLPWKFLFRTICEQQSVPPSFRAQGDDVAYRIELELGSAMDSASQRTTVTLRPTPGQRALRLGFTAWMQVESVTTGPDRSLPFLQWKRDAGGDDLDESVVIDLGEPSAGTEPVSIVVRSTGSLFEPFGTSFFPIEEDDWYPDVPEARSANYDIAITLPAERTAIAPGRLVERKQLGDRHRYVYRTTRPQKASTLYIGRLRSKRGEADGTKIEVYIGEQDVQEKNLDFAIVEMQNIVKVYNRLFFPLETETLRVAGAPIGHGRGFDGLLLLSRQAGFSGDSSRTDLFRAHEVAHQWWGNVVQPDRWPRDRWLSESFAEYASMEYYRARFEDAKKTREQIHRQWVLPLQRSPESSTRNLRDMPRDTSAAELWSILDGRNNVYTKGPMVLQMFRYLCAVKTGGDDAFWEVQRTFLREFAGKPATTEDFIEVSQRILGTDLLWFWSQWLLRTEIPKVRWTSRVEPKDGKWLLTVEATQVDTEFTLFIPVYSHFGGGKVATKPIVMNGKSGKLQILLPQEPEGVTLNDNWEALVEFVK